MQEEIARRLNRAILLRLFFSCFDRHNQLFIQSFPKPLLVTNCKWPTQIKAAQAHSRTKIPERAEATRCPFSIDRLGLQSKSDIM